MYVCMYARLKSVQFEFSFLPRHASHYSTRFGGETSYFLPIAPPPLPQITGLLDWIYTIVARPGFGQEEAAAAAVATEALEGGDGTPASQVGGGSAAGGGASEAMHAGQGEHIDLLLRECFVLCAPRGILKQPLLCAPPNEAVSPLLALFGRWFPSIACTAPLLLFSFVLFVIHVFLRCIFLARRPSNACPPPVRVRSEKCCFLFSLPDSCLHAFLLKVFTFSVESSPT